MSAPQLLIEPRSKDLGSFSVRRVLPYAHRRSVGPFVFFDHMGPAEFAVGAGMDVRPHPHIGLATVTFLFEGAIDHRDNLGNVQTIAPGDINWMTAGSGICHSERSPKATVRRLHGLQLWVALPKEHEEAPPDFTHYPSLTLPEFSEQSAQVKLMVGEAFDRRSPVRVFGEMFYLEVRSPAQTKFIFKPQSHHETALYVVSGELDCDGQKVVAGNMAVFAAGDEVAYTVSSTQPAHLVLIGGAPLAEPRTIWWNFVSTSPERIEKAKADWLAGNFALPPDETEFIPLPES